MDNLFFQAAQIACHVAKDRSNFVLTVECLDSPSLDIQFPLASLPIIIEQLQGLQDGIQLPPAYMLHQDGLL